MLKVDNSQKNRWRSLDLENFVSKNRGQGWFQHLWNQIFLVCCFQSKIKKIWCFKPPVPWISQKNLFSTWNIDTAGYYWKRLQTPENSFKPAVSKFHVENRPFLADSRYRRLKTSWIFLFLMENSILKMSGSMDVKFTIDFCS